MVVKVAVWGASGRLGSLVSKVATDTPGFELVAKLGSSSAVDADKDADLVIDTTNIVASEKIVSRAIKNGKQVLIGTSGWTAEKIAELADTVAKQGSCGVVLIPNFSLGSALQRVLSNTATKFFDAVEIIEMHHDKKIDSPSGTAVYTAEEIMRVRAGKKVAAPFLEQPARGESVSGIPIHSLRLPGILAKQEVKFGSLGETLTVTHETLSDSAYETGIRAALKAAVEARGVTVGLENILELS